ncbi:MAG: GspE/PulE family protein [Polyangiaceae bacterium]
MQSQPPRSIPFAELSQFALDPASVRAMSASFCYRKHVVVLGHLTRDTATATVGMLHPEDGDLVRVVAQALGRPVRPVRLNEFEILKALDIGFGRAEADTSHGERVALKATPDVSFAAGQSAPGIVSQLLGHAVAVGASDIHIECYESDIDVRLRIDGVLHQLGTPISLANIDEVTARIKILSNLNIAERRIAQDGRLMAVFESAEGKRPIDFRVSVVPGPFGEDTVMRILDSRPLVGLDSLGFPPAMLEALRAVTSNPEGLFIVTGPTGSGKTTTLYSVLAELNSGTEKILTAEDPVEYHFNKVNQKQVSAQMSFADYGRAFMRQDPDIIMIGEIRDEETADIAIRAAQTGHLVLSTLHTNGSIGTIPRLGTLGVQPGLVADTLLGALSQRLVRRVCASCSTQVEPNAAELDLMRRLGRLFPVVRGAGCAACHQTGYRGRLGIYELFLVDDAIADLISRSTPAFEIRRHARSRGMRSLFDDAFEKLEAGLTTLDEVKLRVPHRMVLEATGEGPGE